VFVPSTRQIILYAECFLCTLNEYKARRRVPDGKHSASSATLDVFQLSSSAPLSRFWVQLSVKANLLKVGLKKLLVYPMPKHVERLDPGSRGWRCRSVGVRGFSRLPSEGHLLKQMLGGVIPRRSIFLLVS
jgi:hypothetical protein